MARHATITNGQPLDHHQAEQDALDLGDYRARLARLAKALDDRETARLAVRDARTALRLAVLRLQHAERHAADVSAIEMRRLKRGT